MGMKSLNNLPTNLIGRALTHNFSQEENDRREEMNLNKDYYYDKQEQTICLYNDDQDPVVLNVLKSIVRKRASLLYSHAPQREFIGPAASVAFLEAVYAENNIDQLLLQADLNAELTGSALIAPVVDEEMEFGVRLRMWDASTACALANEDNPQTLDALSIVRVVDRIQNEELDVERVLKQQIWTPYKIYTYEGNVLVGTEENPYGFIPFANFKGEEVYDQYLGHAPARGLRILNQNMNAVLTDFQFCIKFQGFTPIAISGMTGDTIVQIHPGRALSLPAGAVATTLSTDPKLQEILEYIKWLEEKAFETSSVPKISVVGGGEATSGRELMIRWFPLLQVFNEKSLRYTQYELELANTVLMVAGLPTLDDINVEYVEAAILPISAEDDDLAQDIELDIRTPADEVKRRNPVLTIDEAKTIVLENKDFNDSLKSMAPSADNITQDPLDEGQDPTQEEPEELDEEQDSSAMEEDTDE